jgi:hypothetical protein
MATWLKRGSGRCSPRFWSDNPTVADPSSERSEITVAELYYAGGPTAVNKISPMAGLNETPGQADRFAFLRVRAKFDYGKNSVQAALGPFAYIDSFKITYKFNG